MITAVLLLFLLGQPGPDGARMILMGVDECDRARANDRAELRRTKKLAALCSRDLQLVEVERDTLTSSIAVLADTLRVYRAATPTLAAPCPECPTPEAVEPGSSPLKVLLTVVATAGGAGAGAAIGAAVAPEGRAPVAASLGAILGGLALAWIPLALSD